MGLPRTEIAQNGPWRPSWGWSMCGCLAKDNCSWASVDPFMTLPFHIFNSPSPSRTKLICTHRCVSFSIFVNKPTQEWRKSVFSERFVHRTACRGGLPCTNEIWSCRHAGHNLFVRCSSVQKKLSSGRIVGTLVSIDPPFCPVSGSSVQNNHA